MNRAFRVIKLIFLALAVLLCLAIPVAGLASTATGWHGVCQGFNHDQHGCPWWKYAGTEMFWASFLFVPLLFAASIIWLVMAAIQFIVGTVRKQKEKATLSSRDEQG